jgi:hypothetical protein
MSAAPSTLRRDSGSAARQTRCAKVVEIDGGGMIGRPLSAGVDNG